MLSERNDHISNGFDHVVSYQVRDRRSLEGDLGWAMKNTLPEGVFECVLYFSAMMNL